MANASGQYRLFGVDRSNFKYDLISFLIVVGLVVLIIWILWTDFEFLWLQEEDDEANTTIEQ